MAKQTNVFSERGNLGDKVVSIEMVSVSIVAGAALSALGSSAADIASLEYLAYWPYVFAGFVFVLYFWAEAISHAISFIDWPLNLLHSFLYFSLGFFQIVAYSNLTDTYVWFWVFLIMSLVGWWLYYVDLGIVRLNEAEITSSKKGKVFYQALVDYQLRGLRYLVPLTVLMNTAALVLMYLAPEIILDAGWHSLIVALQGTFTLGALIMAVRQFRQYSDAIAEIYGTKQDRRVR